jgi:hypothetical protein
MLPTNSRAPSSLLPCLLFLAAVGAGCSPASPGGGDPPAQGSGGSAALGGSGGPATGGSGTGGGSASGGASGGATGGSTATPAGTGGATGGSGATPDPVGEPVDGSAPATPEAGASSDGGGSGTPMGTDGGPQPSYEGEVPVYDGPEVGPVVEMQCPGNPTEGYTEYKDSFHVERPYDVPINARFSFIDGIYNFWVFPGDKAHSKIANGTNPRTEATFGGTYDKATVKENVGNASGIGYFTTGKRIYSADVLIEKSASSSFVFQLHTTAKGIGPIYLSGGGVPGGMLDKWYNVKFAFDAATLKSQVYINNCLKGTVSGPRGDGHFYFKHGVYHCGNGGGCRSHYKNIHFYVQ